MLIYWSQEVFIELFYDLQLETGNLHIQLDIWKATEATSRICAYDDCGCFKYHRTLAQCKIDFPYGLGLKGEAKRYVLWVCDYFTVEQRLNCKNNSSSESFAEWSLCM